jgi:hypothetical protein
MASFVDDTDQQKGHPWLTATEFEPLRMMCLCLTSDPEAAAFCDDHFPLETILDNCTISNFMSTYWHARRGVA